MNIKNEKPEGIAHCWLTDTPLSGQHWNNQLSLNVVLCGWLGVSVPASGPAAAT